jgi:NAD(P)-dependent dehydrogenase (short-subunit alcohol dehydrogenase family)
LSLTKGGLAAVTRSLATEYASRGVRVQRGRPGVIKTPTYDAASYEGLAGPVGRIGEISDIVDAVLYLEQATFVATVREEQLVEGAELLRAAVRVGGAGRLAHVAVGLECRDSRFDVARRERAEENSSGAQGI